MDNQEPWYRSKEPDRVSITEGGCSHEQSKLLAERGKPSIIKNTGATTIEANTVIELTGRVGIAGTDIAPGAEGDLHVCGVFEFDKTSQNEITFGQPVYFDKTGITEASKDRSSNAYTPAGFAAKAAAAGDKKVLVKIG